LTLFLRQRVFLFVSQCRNDKGNEAAFVENNHMPHSGIPYGPLPVYVTSPSAASGTPANGIDANAVALSNAVVAAQAAIAALQAALAAIPQGTSGFSGYSGVSGSNGANGTNGANGQSGISGYSGTSGWSGYSGSQGVSGYSGATSATPTLQQVTTAGATTTANTTFGGNVNWGGTSGASYFDSNGNLHVRSGEDFAIISDDFGRAFLGMSIGDASLELANLTSQTVYSSSNLTLEAWVQVYLYSYNSPIVVGAQSTSLTGGAIDMALPTYFRSTLEFGTGGYIQDDGSGGVTISDAYSCTANLNSNVDGFAVGCNVACPAVSCNTVYFPSGGTITDDGSGGVTITTASGYTLNCNNNGYIYWNNNAIDGGE
jgi:hypothetical protein